MQITRKDIDPRLSNAENARNLGVDPSSITRARKRFGMHASPLAKSRLPEWQKERRAKIEKERSYAVRKQGRAGIDWRMCDLEIAIREGVCVRTVYRWRKAAKPRVKKFSKKHYVLRAIEADKAAAKLSERKTVHEWLNGKGVPDKEHGKPLCLLRRLAIALGIAEHEFNGPAAPIGAHPPV